MQQLEQWFDELRRSLEHRSVIIDQGEDPVFFLVYPPRMSLDVYRALPQWEARLKHFDWSPRRYNLGLEVQSYVVNHPFYPRIDEYLRKHPDELEKVQSSIRDLLSADDDHLVVEEWVEKEIAAASEQKGGLLEITGVELLHPYLQIGRIEQALQGRISCPVVVFYPGDRTGSFGLKYLRFYEADGNYRSRHIGGFAR